MTEVINISKDEAMIDEDSLQDYVDLLNGIVYDCDYNDQYSPYSGCRNEIAVCLTVAAHELGLDSEDVMRKLIDKKIIDPDKDDEDPIVRVRTILDYSRRFSWEWMLSPGYYAVRGRTAKANDDYIPKIWFSL